MTTGAGANANELEAFQHGVEQHLGIKGEIAAFGVSRALRVHLRGRSVEVGTNGSYLWVTADVRWDTFPEDALLAYAPEGSYNRLKFLEDGAPAAKIDDPMFARMYVLLGGSADTVAARLTPQARHVLLEFADLGPEIRGAAFDCDPPRMVRRVHLRVQPDLRLTADESFFVRLGTGRFTPEYAAAVAERLTTCAERLEAV